MTPWQPANNGTGKRIWFLYRDDITPIEDRYHHSANGALIRYASMANAQKAADKLNKQEAQHDHVH